MWQFYWGKYLCKDTRTYFTKGKVTAKGLTMFGFSVKRICCNKPWGKILKTLRWFVGLSLWCFSLFFQRAIWLLKIENIHIITFVIGVQSHCDLNLSWRLTEFTKNIQKHPKTVSWWNLLIFVPNHWTNRFWIGSFRFPMLPMITRCGSDPIAVFRGWFLTSYDHYPRLPSHPHISS